MTQSIPTDELIELLQGQYTDVAPLKYHLVDADQYCAIPNHTPVIEVIEDLIKLYRASGYADFVSVERVINGDLLTHYTLLRFDPKHGVYRHKEYNIAHHQIDTWDTAALVILADTILHRIRLL